MAGFWIIAVAVALNTINKLYTKYLLHKVDSFSMLVYVNLMAGIVALPFAYVYRDSILQLTWAQLGFTLLTAASWSLNGYLGNLSTEKAEVSIREPLVQLQVVWAVLIGIFVFSENLTLQQVAGILTVLLASIVLVWKKEIWQVHITKNSLFIILIYTVVTAIVAAMDKHVMSFLAPQAYLIFNFFVPILFLAPFFKIHKKDLANAKNYWKELVLISVIFMCTFISTLYVYKNFDFAISYPLLKIATPLTAIAGILLFNERTNVNRKLAAIFLATLGVIIIKVSL